MAYYVVVSLLAVRQARLVLGWVTVCWQVNPVYHQP